MDSDIGDLGEFPLQNIASIPIDSQAPAIKCMVQIKSRF